MKRHSKVTTIALCSILTLYIAIVGCSCQNHSITINNNLSLSISLQDNDLASLPENSEPIERKWVRYHNRLHPNFTPNSIMLSFLHKEAKNNIDQEYISIEQDKFYDLWPKDESNGDPVNMVFENDLGKITFNGQIGSDHSSKGVTAFGTVSIEYNNDSIKKIEKEFDQEISLDTLITFVMRNITGEILTGYASCPIELDIKQAGLLFARNYKPQTIQLLIDNDFNFSTDDFIKLANHYVTAEYAIDWKKAGYELSADQLVYANQRYLKTDYAISWKDAGYDLSLEQLHWVDQRYLKASDATAWKNAGYELTLGQLHWVDQRYLKASDATAWKDAGYKLSIEQLHWVDQRYLKASDASAWKIAGYDLSLEQLHWVDQRYLKANEASAWKNAGYELSLAQLHWVQQRYLKANEASVWKKAGYNFSIEDLHKLQQNYVNASFGASLADPSFEYLSADELIELKKSNMSVETINKLRNSKTF